MSPLFLEVTAETKSKQNEICPDWITVGGVANVLKVLRTAPSRLLRPTTPGGLLPGQRGQRHVLRRRVVGVAAPRLIAVARGRQRHRPQSPVCLLAGGLALSDTKNSASSHVRGGCGRRPPTRLTIDLMMMAMGWHGVTEIHPSQEHSNFGSCGTKPSQL